MNVPARRQVDFTYYRPINKYQEEFHKSLAAHKLLIGGYGAGKTYPAIHEAIFHCLDNPRHTFLVCRNTWDTLEDEAMADFVRVCEDAGCVKEFKESKHDLYLPNDCKVIFRPLTLGRQNFKGMHLCGFLIDDPDVVKYSDDISFLWSRLRNPPNVFASRFQTIITSNWEGRNWLWKTYIRDRQPGGDDKFAYWICPTTANPTLHENFVADLAAMHSEEWMQRYVYCNMESHIGLIYHDFNQQVHHFDYEKIKDRTDLIHIMAIDVGLVHPTCVLKMATDGQRIFVYDEWYKKGMKISDVALYLQDQMKQQYFRKIFIDPASNKGDQISGSSIKLELNKYGIHTTDADNAVLNGIRVVQDLLRPAEGAPILYIDLIRCPNLKKELEIYRWKEPRDMDFDDMGYREEPVKKNDDAVDALRYGVVALKRFIRGSRSGEMALQRKEHYRMERLEKLKHYQLYPAMKKKVQLMKTYKKLGFTREKINSLLYESN